MAKVSLHPPSGWPQEAPQRGALTSGKPQGGYYNLFKIKIQLLFFSFFLFANILAYGFFIQTNSTNAVSTEQKCLPFVCLFFSKYRCIRTALLPFKKPIAYAILNFGGTLRHMWIWSGLKLPSNNSTLRCRQRSFIISPTWRLNFPYNFLFRYFGTMTTWYLQSQRTCDKLCQSCIGSSSLCPEWDFPGGRAYFISRRNGRTFPGPPL